MLPTQLINYKVYHEGNNVIGLADVALPEISSISETIKGPGIIGEIDNPVIGNYSSMTLTLNWTAVVEDNIVFIAPKTYLLDLRASIQVYDEILGDYDTRAIKITVKGIPKKLSLGTFDTAVKMGSSTDLEVVYMKLSINGKEMLEIDKFNYKNNINGVDYLAKVRKDLGM